VVSLSDKVCLTRSDSVMLHDLSNMLATVLRVALDRTAVAFDVLSTCNGHDFVKSDFQETIRIANVSLTCHMRQKVHLVNLQSLKLDVPYFLCFTLR